MSCHLHLYNVWIWQSTKYGAYELLCLDCIEGIRRSRRIWYGIAAGLVLAVVCLVLFGMWNNGFR